jgi:membrane protein
MATATWENHRGRNASSPKEIPAKGWKDTLMRVKEELKHDRISMVSAAMAYYALFAFVPALTSVVLIYAWVSDPSEIAGHIAKAKQVMPAEIMDTVNVQLQGLASKASSKLGFGAIFSVLLSLYAASKGTKAAIEAMNIIYEEEDQRGFFKLNGLAVGMTLLAAVLAILAMGVIVGIPAITSLFNFGDTFEMLATAGSWVVLLAIFSFFLSFLYRFGPDRQNAKWKWVSVGAITAAVLWAVVSALFSWYAKEFGNFNKTYGSLAAVIVLMTWFFLSSYVILLGGEINAELEHQTKRDSTTGTEKPLGTRGAKMADEVGASAEEIKSSSAKTSGAQDHHQGLSGLKKFFSRGNQHRA